MIRPILSLLAAGALALTVTACDDVTGAGTCESPKRLLYFSPGCDAGPTCASAVQDACSGTACSCQGETITIGCGFHASPFASFGPCPGQDSDGVVVGDVDAAP